MHGPHEALLLVFLPFFPQVAGDMRLQLAEQEAAADKLRAAKDEAETAAKQLQASKVAAEEAVAQMKSQLASAQEQAGEARRQAEEVQAYKKRLEEVGWDIELHALSGCCLVTLLAFLALLACKSTYLHALLACPV
jgi:predicted amidohydrolase YtcJ